MQRQQNDDSALSYSNMQRYAEQREQHHHSTIREKAYKDIEPHALISISDATDTIITGTIGKCATIVKTGLGDLKINALIEENVKFIISGQGNVIFYTRPSDNVIHLIEKSGDGRIEMPGAFASSSSARPISRVNNNIHLDTDALFQLAQAMNSTTRTPNHPNNAHTANTSLGSFIAANPPAAKPYHPSSSCTSENDGRTITHIPHTPTTPESISSSAQLIDFEFMPLFPQIFSVFTRSNRTRSDNRPHHTQNSNRSVTASSSTSAHLAASPTKKSDHSKKGYSLHLQEYLASFDEKKETLSNKIKNLNLTSDEEKLFQQFIDPLTAEYIKIPVMLYERHYDLKSVENLIATKSEDPFSRKKFQPIEIQSARRLFDELENAIQKLAKMRKMQALTTNGTFPIAKNNATTVAKPKEKEKDKSFKWN